MICVYCINHAAKNITTMANDRKQRHPVFNNEEFPADQEKLTNNNNNNRNVLSAHLKISMRLQ